MIQSYFQMLAQAVALGVDAAAVLIVALAALDAAFRSVHNALVPARPLNQRAIWLRFAGWILLALEFSLGADVVGTAIAPTWDAIGKLAAIAIIRTFLNYFLARDIDEARKLRPQPSA